MAGEPDKPRGSAKVKPEVETEREVVDKTKPTKSDLKRKSSGKDFTRELSSNFKPNLRSDRKRDFDIINTQDKRIAELEAEMERRASELMKLKSATIPGALDMLENGIKAFAISKKCAKDNEKVQDDILANLAKVDAYEPISPTVDHEITDKITKAAVSKRFNKYRIEAIQDLKDGILRTDQPALAVALFSLRDAAEVLDNALFFFEESFEENPFTVFIQAKDLRDDLVSAYTAIMKAHKTVDQLVDAAVENLVSAKIAQVTLAGIETDGERLGLDSSHGRLQKQIADTEAVKQRALLAASDVERILCDTLIV